MSSYEDIKKTANASELCCVDTWYPCVQKYPLVSVVALVGVLPTFYMDIVNVFVVAGTRTSLDIISINV